MPTTNPGPVLDEMARQVAQQSETLAMHIANHGTPDGGRGPDLSQSELYLRAEHEAGRAIEIAEAAHRDVTGIQERQRLDADRLEQHITQATKASSHKADTVLADIRQAAQQHSTRLSEQFSQAIDTVKDENAGHLAALQEHHERHAGELESANTAILSEIKENQATGLRTLEAERARLVELHQQETERQRIAISTIHKADLAANLQAYETATADALRSLLEAHADTAEKSASEFRTAVQTALDALRNAHQTAMADADARHEQAVATLQDAHRTATAEAATRHEQAIHHLDEQYQTAMQQAATDLNANHQRNLDSTAASFDIRHRRFTRRLIAVCTAVSSIAIAAIMVAILL